VYVYVCMYIYRVCYLFNFRSQFLSVNVITECLKLDFFTRAQTVVLPDVKVMYLGLLNF
jgi:hypothetical protein